MKHADFKEMLQLFLYGELEPGERQAIESHLADCAECRQELHNLEEMRNLLQVKPAVDEQLLQEARQELRAALRLERSRRRFAVSSLFNRAPAYKLALSGAAMLVLGVVLGRFLQSPPGSPRQAGAELQGETRITNVRFLESAGGGVDFTFEAVTPVRMKGNAEDPAIQKVLTHAMLNDLNPGVRLRAVSAIGQPQARQADREIRAALILSLKSDPNAGVRREALTALSRYKMDTEIKNAVIQVLMYDKNPGLRIAAINALDSSLVREPGGADKSILDILREKEQKDDNNYIRLKARAVREEIEKP